MREVLERRENGDPACALGYAVYEHRLRGQLAAMVAALGGLDVLALTGGVGEASATVRRTAVDSLGYLGLRLDEGFNDPLDGDHLAADGIADLTGDGSSARVVVVAAREDVEIARSAVDVLVR
jgi:acetate kinase